MTLEQIAYLAEIIGVIATIVTSRGLGVAAPN